MSCKEYLANVSMRMPMRNYTERPPDITDHINYIFNEIGVPLICCFGVVGNILNLAVLTRKQLQSTMDRMEKSAHLGLVALAISDLLFCLSAIPIAFVDAKTNYYYNPPSLFPLYYNKFKIAILSIFLTCSTWLTVVMASARYLAICHPLHARGFINLCGTKITITVVFVMSICINLPRFWQKKIYYKKITEECEKYVFGLGHLFRNKKFEYSYEVIWAILCVFLPIIVLAFCNICLIRALQQSMHMQRKYRVNRPKQDSGHRITPTLVTIVVLFLILVIPTEVIKFVNFIHENLLGVKKQNVTLYAAQIITNFMQACNFAINFVLYCILNVHFRKTIMFVLSCQWRFKKKSPISQQSHTMTLITDIETDM